MIIQSRVSQGVKINIRPFGFKGGHGVQGGLPPMQPCPFC